MRWPQWVILIAGSTGSALRVVRPPNLHITPGVPAASVTKIITAWLALQVLGTDYRFETRFYLDSKRVLSVRGGGDPLLSC